MKNTTRWQPDTCGCVIDYEWDDKDPPETRVHTLKTLVKACPFHSGPPNISMTMAHGDNVRKNRAIANAIEIDPALKHEDIKWSYDDSRLLHISITKFDNSKKATLRAKYSGEFGPDKVIIEV